MQPFDALTMKAVLAEAKPLLLNRRVEKVAQSGRDEVVLSLRSKVGTCNLLISAQTPSGRICLLQKAPAKEQIGTVTKEKSAAGKNGKGGAQGSQKQSNFLLSLKRHLTGATLVAVEQPTGDRMVDFIFSCIDEVGGASFKVLTIEIMGRHSNLIFWDKGESRILAASHAVTSEMSSKREIGPGLRFERPPEQTKPNIFQISRETLSSSLEESSKAPPPSTPPGASPSMTQWLLSSFTGIGKTIAEDIVESAGLPLLVSDAMNHTDVIDRLWNEVERLRDVQQFRAAMRVDLARYAIFPWQDHSGDAEWREFATVNEMIEEYYNAVEVRDHLKQLRQRMQTELKEERKKIESRLASARQHADSSESISELKKFGDLILANIQAIGAGQEELTCDDIMDGQEQISIKLNPNLSPSQNAQAFYKQYAKSRTRQSSAIATCTEAEAKIAALEEQMQSVESALDANELYRLRDAVIGRKASELPQAGRHAQPKKQKSKILSTTSSDNWIIYVGRNRMENDYLLSKMAKPEDLWLHNLGQGGAHVLIKLPASKQEPPARTLREAAQIAARLSKASQGSKVRVIYTQCKHVKKITKAEPGTVRYEKEKTLEVDTSEPMPKCMSQLFSS